MLLESNSLNTFPARRIARIDCASSGATATARVSPIASNGGTATLTKTVNPSQHSKMGIAARRIVRGMIGCGPDGV